LWTNFSRECPPSFFFWVEAVGSTFLSSVGIYGVGAMLQTQKTPPRKTQTIHYCLIWRINISVSVRVLANENKHIRCNIGQV
jgi:hypothetical protein